MENNAPSAQTLNDIQRDFLKLLLEFVSSNKSAQEIDRTTAVPPAFTTIEVDDWKVALELWSSKGLPLLADIPARACPACNVSKSHTIFQSYDGYHFNECEHCGTWYVPLVVDWPLFERFLSECPAAATVAKKSASMRMEMLATADLDRFDSYFRSVLDLLPPPRVKRRYLDIGCSVGHSLTAARAAGMESHGVEADPNALAIAKANHEVVAYRIGDLPGGKYDVVSMWETLEHLADPLATLREAAARLSAGGLIVVTVPNLDALSVRVLREKCSYAYGGYNSPGHINFFNHRTIKKLFERAGLVLADVSYEFSSNPDELFGYLGGLSPSDQPYAVAAPPPFLAKVLNAIWPAVTLLEDFGSTLPIMQCIACRAEDAYLFSQKCKERSESRRNRIIATANNQLAKLRDPTEQLASLEKENHRMHGALQGEVNKRDALLVDLQQRFTSLEKEYHWMHGALQGEVNKRDALLVDLQQRFNELSTRT